MKQAFVYILASGKHGTLYVGVTSNLAKPIWEHKEGIIDGFTKRYNIHNLVYYEGFDDITNAIEREKQIKNWRRDWKINVIESANPHWDDLYGSVANG